MTTRNPVAVRIYKVLAANFSDPSTRDALNTVSEFYLSPPSTSSSSDPGDTSVEPDAVEHRDSDSDEEDTSDQDGSATTTRLPGDTAAKARKRLRKDVERKLAEGSQQFLDAFAGVNQKLDALQEHVGTLRVRCDEAEGQIRLTSDECKSLLERAGRLRSQRQSISDRQSIITLLLSSFTLTEDEQSALTSREVPLGARFFAAMDRTEQIRNDCRVLMNGEDGVPTKAGLDIMAATLELLEQAYEKIFRYCSLEFRQFGRDAQLDVAPVIREAVKRLRQRPELLNESLAILAQTRQSAVLRLFLDALTRGGPSGLPRPIELHAHDPMRYVGDMLAWVHQAVAGEREFLEGLFSVGGDGRMVGSVRRFEGGREEEGWIAEMMDASVEKLCVPLKVRVTQTIRSQESSIMLFNIAHLLQFYSLTMGRTIGVGSPLTKTLQDIADLSHKTFTETIEASGRALQRTPLDWESAETTPPLVILDHGQKLKEILTAYRSSVLEGQTDEEVEAGIRGVVDGMVDPAIEMVAVGGAEKKERTPGWDQVVFEINCLSFVQDLLEPFSRMIGRAKIDEVEGLLRKQVEALKVEHYHATLVDCGLWDLTQTEMGETSASVEGMEGRRVRAGLERFAQWLSEGEVVSSRRLSEVRQRGIEEEVHRATLRRVVRAYGTVCGAVRRGVEGGATVVGSYRPFGQEHPLLQIFGLD